jgi:hypothetical protein
MDTQKSIGVAVALSVLWPGLGHAYVGRRGRGLLFGAVAALLAAVEWNLYRELRASLTAQLAVAIAAIGAWGWGAHDARLQCRAHNGLRRSFAKWRERDVTPIAGYEQVPSDRTDD